MTRVQVYNMIKEANLPAALHHFSNSTEPPFIVFNYTDSNDLYADQCNYKHIETLEVQLYTDEKRFDLESTLEGIFASHGLTYEKEQTYIDDELMFETIYTMEVLING